MNYESKNFHLQDALLLIGLMSGTGELVLESGNNIGSIILHNGKILQAFSPYSRAIGDLLVEDGLITEAALLEILYEQKRGAISPIGSLFLKTGKVSFEVIEMMVHEQIRTSLKEFTTWENVRASFVDKEVIPFDSIHLTVHEFIAAETMKSGLNFFAVIPRLKDKASSSTATTTV